MCQQNYTRKEKKIKNKMTLTNVHKYIREYNETTGIQGLHYLTDKRSVTEKIVWGLILLISLSGCFWMIYEILEKYQNSPIVIGFANEPGYIDQIPFPAVTICPLTKVSKSKSCYEGIESKLKNNISLNDEELAIVKYRSFLCLDAVYYSNEIKRNVPHMLNDETMLNVMEKVVPEFPFSECGFMGKGYKCTHIFTRVLTSEGICYSFNVMDRSEIFRNKVFHYKDFHQVKRNSSAFDGESGYNGDIGPDTYPQRALIVGMFHGLHFWLHQMPSDGDDFCGYIVDGYRLMLHHPAEIWTDRKEFFHYLPNEKILIASITPELIRTSNKIKNYNVEKRNCYLKGEKHLKYYQIYTQNNCHLECLTNITLSQCGCVDFYMPRINGTEFICNTKLESRICIGEAEKYFYEKVIESNKANSGITKYYFACKCLPLCTELKYNLDITKVEFGKTYLQHIAKRSDIFKSNLQINFKSSSFSVLERNELYGTTDFICNFGGLLGLFTGFSFISLAEIVYFLTLRIWCNTRLYGRWSGPPN